MRIIRGKAMSVKKKRINYAIAFVILLLVEVIIALYVRDSFVRPYMGDLLVVIVLYTGIRIFIPDGYRLLPLYIFIFATLVEYLQYFKIVELIGAQNNVFLRILLGSVFDVKDIMCYGIGCVLLGIYQWKANWGQAPKDADNSPTRLP